MAWLELLLALALAPSATNEMTSKCKLWNSLDGTISTVVAGGPRVLLSPNKRICPRGASLLQVTELVRRHRYLILYHSKAGSRVGAVRFDGSLEWSLPVKAGVQSVCTNFGENALFLVGQPKVERISWRGARPSNPTKVGKLDFDGAPYQFVGAVGSNETLFVSVVSNGGGDAGGGLAEFAPQGAHYRKFWHDIRYGTVSIISGQDHRRLVALGFGNLLTIVTPSGKSAEAREIAVGKPSDWMMNSASISPDDQQILVADRSGRFAIVTVARGGSEWTTLPLNQTVGPYPQIFVDWNSFLVIEVDTEDVSRMHVMRLDGARLRLIGKPFSFNRQGWCLVSQS